MTVNNCCQEAVGFICSHLFNMTLQHGIALVLSCSMMSSVALGRPSCVPITLHCTAYCGVKYRWRSFSVGVVFTRELRFIEVVNYSLITHR